MFSAFIHVMAQLLLMCAMFSAFIHIMAQLLLMCAMFSAFIHIMAQCVSFLRCHVNTVCGQAVV
jgi:hypothetical protein